MGLWILSQDRKNLIKVDNIFIDDEVGNDFCHLMNNSIILGTYNVERAMKIIDDIKERILNLQLVDCEERGVAREAVRRTPYLECVYTMPKV